MGDGGEVVVDELVADTDGVDRGPVAVDLGDETRGVGGDRGEAEEPSEDLRGRVCADGGEGVGHLVAVDAVEAD